MDSSKLSRDSLKADLVRVIDTGEFYIDHEPMTERYIRAGENMKHIQRTAMPFAVGRPKKIACNESGYDVLWILEAIFWIDKKSDFGREKYGKYLVVEFGYDASESVMDGRLFAYYDGIDSVKLHNIDEAILFMRGEYQDKYTVILA